MEERLKLLSRAMQAGTVAVAIAGIVTGNLTWVPAAIIALLISLIPSILRRDLKITLPIELNFWIVLALFLHVVGGFSGFYDSIPGWDHLTHMMSSSLIGALGFVTVVIVDKYVKSIYLPRPFLSFFIVMFTMAMGVLWELMEFANDSLAHTQLQYGLTDTMVDLLFDGIAGFIVAIFGVQYLLRVSADHFVDSLHVDEAKDKIVDYLQKRRDSV